MIVLCYSFKEIWFFETEKCGLERKKLGRKYRLYCIIPYADLYDMNSFHVQYYY